VLVQRASHIQNFFGEQLRRRANVGFSLLEVLIATTVFALGLAGFAALLLTSMKGSVEARQEGVAAMAAASLAEQIRLNPMAIGRYLNPPDDISRRPHRQCQGAGLPR